jgi:hypothetical protein
MIVEDNISNDSRATTTIKTSENNYTEDKRNMNIDRDVYDFADDDIADVNNDDNNNQANNNQTRGIINCNNTVPLLPVSSELRYTLSSSLLLLSSSLLLSLLLSLSSSLLL